MKHIYFLVVPLVSAGVVWTTPQIPIHKDVTEVVVKHIAQEELAPTIGVHFATSYAVAAARYHNGTIRDLVRVTADAEYIDLLSRWTQGQKQQDCHFKFRQSSAPRESSSRYHCVMHSLQRSSRQILGLPSSRDVAILSGFMKRVRSAIEANTFAPVTSIAPAFPRLSRSQEDDVQEALFFAGLESTRIHTEHAGAIVYEDANAAYAGLGHGLCNSQSSHSHCQSAARLAKDQSVLYFNFDNSSFSVGAMTLKNAFQEHRTYTYGLDTTLGWWDLPVYEIPRAKFWARVHEMILDVLTPMSIPPNRIVLLGDHGADEEFKEVVKVATWDKFEFDVEMMLKTVKKEDVGMLAARGAAELGWQDEEFKRAYESRRRDMEGAVEL